MAVRGPVGVDDRLVVDRPVDGLQQAAPRWGAPRTVGPCQATAVPMAVVRPMPRPAQMATVIAANALHGMAAGSAPGVEIDPAIGLVSGLGIALVIGLQIDQRSALAIAPEIASAIAPVPSTAIRTPFVRSLRTTAQVRDVFEIGTIDTLIVVAPGMNGANRPSGLDPVMTRAVPSGWMQYRRLQRPLPQRTT